MFCNSITAPQSTLQTGGKRLTKIVTFNCEKDLTMSSVILSQPHKVHYRQAADWTVLYCSGIDVTVVTCAVL